MYGLLQCRRQSTYGSNRCPTSSHTFTQVPRVPPLLQPVTRVLLTALQPPPSLARRTPTSLHARCGPAGLPFCTRPSHPPGRVPIHQPLGHAPCSCLRPRSSQAGQRPYYTPHLHGSTPSTSSCTASRWRPGSLPTLQESAAQPRKHATAVLCNASHSNCNKHRACNQNTECVMPLQGHVMHATHRHLAVMCWLHHKQATAVTASPRALSPTSHIYAPTPSCRLVPCAACFHVCSRP